MRALTITRTVLVRVLSGPSGVVAALALLCAWPSLLVLAPSGISSGGVLPSAWLYELAFVGLAVGAVLGLAGLERIAPLLARGAAGERLASEWLALVASGLAGAALALLPAFLCGVDAGPSPASLVARILLSLMATAAGGMAIARICRTPGVAPWLLASGILSAPMILPPSPTPRSLVLLTSGFVLAAWLLAHTPRTSAEAR